MRLCVQSASYAALPLTIDARKCGLVMASAENEQRYETPKRSFLPRRKRLRLALVLCVLLVAAGLLAWTAREEIADDLIASELDQLGLEASYDVEEIGADRQVLTNLVIGDTDKPDLTVERVVAQIGYGFAAPKLGELEVHGARLFGSYTNGKLSFGSLDELLLAENDEPAGLPAIDLNLIDARALIESDLGDIGIKVDGRGKLDDGFIGKIAATSPGFSSQFCVTTSATIYGDLTTNDGAPSFAGPIRLRELQCSEQGVSLASLDLNAEIALASDFASASGEIGVAATEFSGPGAGAEALSGDVQFSWADHMLTARHDLTANRTVTDFGAISDLTADGTLRAREGFGRIEWDAQIDGEGTSIGGDLASHLDSARDASKGTLAAPLLTRLKSGLSRATKDGSFAADLTLRMSPASTSIVIPQGRLRSTSGETVLALSRFTWASSQNASGKLSANIATGGADIPRISGRMERVDGGTLALQLRMEDYTAAGNRFAVPELRVSQSPNGALQIDGAIRATGDLPGGRVENLAVPIIGSWSPRAGLLLGQDCANVRFDSLTLYELTLDKRDVSLCPSQNGALIRYRDEFQIDGRIAALALGGDISGTPMSATAASVEFSYPGNAQINDLDIAIGNAEEPIRLSAKTLNANFGETIGGTFGKGEVRFDFAASDPAAIYQIPFELVDLQGGWIYNETLVIDDASFTLQDRLSEARFSPLTARGAQLTLTGNTIIAEADLRHPASDRVVTNAQITHELGTGVGGARLSVAGLRFDEQLQPDDLTILTKGFVTLANGRITGNGRIDWSPNDLTSSGTFQTDQFDFAAAFGPVKDARAKVEFTDLLALTTAPGQEIELGSINTGIEVQGGKVRYSLVDGQLIKLEDARWPFMGGELIMRPIDLNFAVPEERRYIFEIINLDAGTFISEMEFGNLAASGKFNGSLPIIFDAQGNGRIEGGLLISESPGGNLSYIGDLTYEDLGTISNYAFNMLRSLDYRQMAVTMDGSLTGEIITSIRFDGISQGEGSSQNFVTRRLAKLPIRFNVNVRSQFWELSRLLRSTYDSEYLRDPCLTSDPKWRASRFFEVACANRPDVNPEDEPLDDLLIQPNESENVP